MSLNIIKNQGIAVIYDWQPGDATRYEIEFVAYDSGKYSHATVAWLNGVHHNGRDSFGSGSKGGSSMRLYDHMPDVEYIAEKMGLRAYDAGVIEGFLKLAWDNGWSHSNLQSAVFAAPEGAIR